MWSVFCGICVAGCCGEFLTNKGTGLYIAPRTPIAKPVMMDGLGTPRWRTRAKQEETVVVGDDAARSRRVRRAFEDAGNGHSVKRGGNKNGASWRM